MTRMSIRNIQRLSMNEHYFALVLQCFLTGYGRPCHLKMVFMSLPILMYSESRKKLKKANKASRIDTIFSSKQNVLGTDISGREQFSGFVQRYDMLLAYCKKAVIILSSEGKATVTVQEVSLLEPVDYKAYSGEVREWLRCAFYLGVIFSKTTYDNLVFYLGVE